MKTRLICQTIFTPCGHFGLPNDYAQIQSLDDKAMNDSFNRAYAEVALREAAAPYKKGVAELIALARVAVLNIRGLVSSANALAMDYNPNIDRYVCQLNFTYEPTKLKSVAIFGIAKAVRPGMMAGAMTEQWQLLGTPEYMAPEQLRGAGTSGGGASLQRRRWPQAPS